MKIKPEYKFKLVEALLECPSVSEPERRNALINNLPNTIKNSTKRNFVSRVDVVNLVTRCLDFPDGIKKLF